MRPIIFVIALVILTACGAASAAPAPSATPDPVAAGGRIFTNLCAACHTVSDTAADTLGPRLSAMVTRAKANADPNAWLHAAITDPAAEVAPGYQPVMMSYSQSLSAADLDAIVTYILEKGGS